MDDRTQSLIDYENHPDVKDKREREFKMKILKYMHEMNSKIYPIEENDNHPINNGDN